MTEQKHTLPKRRRKTTWILSGIAVLIALALTLLPHAIRLGLKKALESQGMSAVNVEDIDLNLFTGELKVHLLQAQAGEDARMGLNLAAIQIDWWPIWKKRIWVRGLTLEGITLDVQKSADGRLTIGGLAIESSAPPVPKEPTPEPTEPWEFGIGAIALQDVKVRYRDPQIQADLTIVKGQFDPMATWMPEKNSQIDLEMLFNGGHFTAKGSARPFSPEPAAAIDLAINQFPLDWVAPLLEAQKVKTPSGTLATRSTIQFQLNPQTGELDLEVIGTLDLENLRAKTPEAHLAHGALHWDGDVKLQQTATDQPPALSVKGVLKAPNLDLMLNEPALHIREGELTWSGSVKMNADTVSGQAGELALEVNGTLGLENLVAQTPDVQLAHGTLNWDGEVKFQQTAPDQPPALSLKGALKAPNLDLVLNDPALRIREEELTWSGSVKMEAGTASGEQDIQVESASTIKNLIIDDTAKGLNLARLKHLSVQDLHIQGMKRIAAGDVRLAEALIFQHPAKEEAPQRAASHIFSFKELALAQLGLENQNKLSIDSINLNGLDTSLARTPQGALELDQWLAPSAGENQPAKDEKESSQEPAPPMQVRIGLIAVNGGSTVHFRDASVKPASTLTATDLALQIGAIDSSQPDLASAIDLKGRINKYATIDIGGDARIFAAKPTFDLKAGLKSLNLPPLSSYTVPAAGYGIKSGVLDTRIDLSAKAGSFTGEVAVVANKLVLQALKVEQNDELTKTLGLPLNTALSLLRDRKDNIKLKIPLAGSIDDPRFGTGALIRQATTKALTNSVLAVCSPLGLPFKAAGKLVNLATALRFEPVGFAPGSSELDAPSKERLTRAAEMLRERPGVRLVLTGFATAADTRALQAAAKNKTPAQTETKGAQAKQQPPPVPREELFELATLRGETVKDYLLDMGKGQIEAERLMLNNPEVEPRKETPPQVMVSL